MIYFFFSSRRRHTRLQGDWSSDVCSSDLHDGAVVERAQDGTLHLRDEAGNEDDGLATLTGGTIGLLIGILAGPLGVLLGGAVGLLAGAIVDAEDDDDTDSVLEHISRSIGNGETAVLADVG